MMTMIEQRAAVVAAARAWIGTPYHNCADVKGVGVDCGMLLVRVFCDLGLVPPFDPRPYPPDWHLHNDGEKYLAFVFDHAREIARGEVEPGDVVVFRYGRCYAHGGIVTAAVPLAFAHAYQPARCVTEEIYGHGAALSDPKRRPRYFSFWNKPPGGAA